MSSSTSTTPASTVSACHRYLQVDCGDVCDESGLRWSDTSFKKLSKLMKYLEEKKLVTLKEIQKQPVVLPQLSDT